MDTETFGMLLQQQESEKLDFKETPYDLGGTGDERKVKLAKFVKDILAMKNTPMPGDAYILLGVRHYADGGKVLRGVTEHPDEAVLQNILVNWVSPHPRLIYSPFAYEGMTFGVIHIPEDRRVGPCMSLKDQGRVLKSNVVYVRTGSRNSEAAAPTAAAVFDWFRTSGKGTPRGVPLPPDSSWATFVESIGFSDPARQYLLLVSELPKPETFQTDNLHVVPWTCVVDFDPRSSSTGLLSKCRRTMESMRTIHQVTLGDAMPDTGGKGTWWYFARGVEGRGTTLCEGSWKVWTGRYGEDLQVKLAHVARSSASPLTVVALWEEELLIKHLDTTLQRAMTSMGDRVRMVIVTDHLSEELAQLVDDYDAKLVQIPLSQFFSGLAQLAGDTDDSEEKAVLPSLSGALVTVDPRDLAWIQEDGVLVHRDIGRRAPEGMTGVGAFLRGREISWYELGLRIDVERDLAYDLSGAVRKELGERKCSRINLFYAPGAGATTLVRRLLWDVRREYPCIVLHRCTPLETAERLRKVYAITDLPLLVKVDGSQVTDRQCEELFNLLSAGNIPCVLLQVSRRFEKHQQGKRTFFLESNLTGAEAERFLFAYSREAPDRRPALEQCARAVGRTDCTPFCLGLIAFEENFATLEKYVSERIAGLNDLQVKLLAFVCISHCYGQKPIPTQAFASLLGLPADRSVELGKVLPACALSLLLEEPTGYWRTIHYIVAQEVLQEILAGKSEDKRTWRQQLADWAVVFADFCCGGDGETPDEMLDIARRVYIYRDDADVLGTERSASQLYGRLLTDIPIPQAQMRVLRHLVDVFPEEAHFWAHLGRFMANNMCDYDEALHALNKALSLSDSDHVLHHMKGMVLRNQAYDSIRAGADISEAIDLAKKATACFEDARGLNNEDEHGYISEVQMRVRLIDYCAQLRKEKPVLAVANQEDAWLRECFQAAEELLGSVRLMRGGEPPSHFEENCRAMIDSLYGSYDQALQTWDNLLNRRSVAREKSVYAPPIRRQIVWTHLARNGRHWVGLSRSAQHRIVTLLEENLREEPNDARNIRLWVQAVRHMEQPPALDRLVEKVAYWRAASNSLEAMYYLYVLHAVSALSGSRLALQQMERVLDECRQRSRYNRLRTRSFEWVGTGAGINMLVHQSQLGEWDAESRFWTNSSSLLKINGLITEINGPQAGTIEVEGGLKAFFVPSVSEHAKGRSENLRVTFFLGFSYDGPRAWSVADA